MCAPIVSSTSCGSMVGGCAPTRYANVWSSESVSPVSGCVSWASAAPATARAVAPVSAARRVRRRIMGRLPVRGRVRSRAGPSRCDPLNLNEHAAMASETRFRARGYVARRPTSGRAARRRRAARAPAVLRGGSWPRAPGAGIEGRPGGAPGGGRRREGDHGGTPPEPVQGGAARRPAADRRVERDRRPDPARGAGDLRLRLDRGGHRARAHRGHRRAARAPGDRGLPRRLGRGARGDQRLGADQAAARHRGADAAAALRPVRRRRPRPRCAPCATRRAACAAWRA